MKNKKWLLLCILYFTTHIGFSQIVSNTSDLTVNLLGGPCVSHYFGKNISGNIPIIRLYGGARISYFLKSGAGIESGYGFSTLGTYENNEYLKISHTASYHQIPFMLKYKKNKTTWGAGAEFNVLDEAQIKDKNQISLMYNLNETYKSNFWAGSADVSYDITNESAVAIGFNYGLQPLLKGNFDWKAGSIRILVIFKIY